MDKLTMTIDRRHAEILDMILTHHLADLKTENAKLPERFKRMAQSAEWETETLIEAVRAAK